MQTHAMVMLFVCTYMLQLCMEPLVMSVHCYILIALRFAAGEPRTWCRVTSVSYIRQLLYFWKRKTWMVMSS